MEGKSTEPDVSCESTPQVGSIKKLVQSFEQTRITGSPPNSSPSGQGVTAALESSRKTAYDSILRKPNLAKKPQKPPKPPKPPKPSSLSSITTSIGGLSLTEDNLCDTLTNEKEVSKINNSGNFRPNSIVFFEETVPEAEVSFTEFPTQSSLREANERYAKQDKTLRQDKQGRLLPFPSSLRKADVFQPERFAELDAYADQVRHTINNKRIDIMCALCSIIHII